MNLKLVFLFFLNFKYSDPAGIGAVIKIARIACEIALTIYSTKRPLPDASLLQKPYIYSKLYHSILLDHHFQTVSFLILSIQTNDWLQHIEFPTEILSESMLNFLQNPSELSRKIFVQDCERYRPSSILLVRDYCINLFN